MFQDLFNRVSNIDLNVADIAASLKSTTKEVSKTEASKNEDTFNKIISIMEEIEKNTRKEMKDSEDATKKVTNFIEKQKKTKTSGKLNKKEIESINIMREAAKALTNASLATSNSLKNMDSASKLLKDASAQVGGKTNQGGVASNLKGGFGKLLSIGSLVEMYKLAGKIQTRMNQLFDIDPKKSFTGVIKGSIELRENIRSIIHMQQGYGRLNREIEKEYLNTAKAARAAGIIKSKYDAIYLQNLQRGYSYVTEQERIQEKLATKGLKSDKADLAIMNMRNKRFKSITSSAISASNFLGSNAENMNEIFMDWHYHLGLSSLELGEMGRSMVSIARSSGVTGQQFEKALQSSSSIVKNLKDLGIASVNNIKKTTEFMVSAEKFGAERAGEFMQSLYDPQAFQESKMQTFLMKSGMATDNREVMFNLPRGTLPFDPKLMKSFVSGMEKTMLEPFKPFEGILKDIGIDFKTIKPEEIDKVLQQLAESDSDAAKNAYRSIQIAFSSAYGIKPGEAVALLKTAQEAGKSTLEKVNELQSKRDELAKGGFGETEEYKRRNMAYLEASTSLQMDAFGRLSKFSKDLKDNKGLISPELEAKMTNELKGAFGDAQAASDFLKNVSTNSEKLLQDLAEQAKVAGFDQEGFKKLFADEGFSIEQIQEKLKVGEEGALLVVQQVMSEIQGKTKAEEDPATSIRYLLETEISGKLSGIIGALINMIPDDVMKAIIVGGFALQALTPLVGLLQLFKGGFGAMKWAGGAAGGMMKKGWNWMTGKGGKAVAEGAAGTGGKALVEGAAESGGKALAEGAAGTGGKALAEGTPKGGWLKKMVPKTKKGALGLGLAAGAAVVGTLGWLFSGSEKAPVEGSPEGLSEADDVLSVLKQIEINTRCICGNAGGFEQEINQDLSTGQGAEKTGFEQEINQDLSTGQGAEKTGLLQHLEENYGIDTPTLRNLGINAGEAALPAGPSVGKAISSFSAPKIPPAPSVPPIVPVPPMAPVPPASGGGFFSKLLGSAKGAAGKAWGGITGVAGSAGKYVSEKVGLTKAMESLGKFIGPALPNIMKKSAGVLKGGLGKIPLIGSIIQLLQTGLNINDIAQQKDITKEDLYKQVGETVLGDGLGFLAGTILGSLGGAAGAGVGAVGGPLAAITGALGGIGGYAAGDYLGRMVGSAISEYVGGPTLGKLIMDMFSDEKSADFNVGGVGEPGDVLVPQFEKGTRKISQTGLAELHKGEMVIPSHIWDKIQAIGTGNFGSGNDVISNFSKIADFMHPLNILQNFAEGPIEIIKNAVKTLAQKQTKNMPVNAAAVSLGLFDPEKTGEANDDYTQNTIAKMFGINGFADFLKNIAVAKGKTKDGDVNTNSMDYSDDMRGEVGSLGLSRTAAESAVEQAKYGSSPSGNTSVLPSMDSIADYLIVDQAKKLDQMILVMEQIRDKLSGVGTFGSEVIKSNASMMAPSTRPGIKNIAQDFNRGSWDLTFGDYSAGQVTNDGRGGLS